MFRYNRLIVLLMGLLPIFSVFGQANPESDAATRAVFDMDATKEGLDYLNYNDDYVARRSADGTDLSGLGASSRASAGQGRSDSDHPKILLPAIVGVRAADYGITYFIAGVFSPLLAAGSADQFETPDKFITNRPVGRRDGSGGHNFRRNLGTTTLENFDPNGGRPASTIQRDVVHHSAGSVLIRQEDQNLFKLPKVDMTVEAYQTDLPEKQATNRPMGRTSGGRGNARQLYPAHPNSP